MDIGAAVGRAVGISEEQIEALPNWRASDRFSEVEKAVLEYAEGMTQTPVRVSEEVFERLQRHFDERQLVELTASIAWENYRARFNHALEVPSMGLYPKPVANP